MEVGRVTYAPDYAGKKSYEPDPKPERKKPKKKKGY